MSAMSFGRLRQARGRSFISRWTGRQTGIVIASLVLILAVLQFSWIGALVLSLVSVPVLAVTVVPFGTSNRTLTDRGIWHLRGWRARTSGSDEYAAGPLTTIDRGDNLPGVAGALMPLDIENGRGGRQNLIWNRRTGLVSARLRVSPVGLALADEADQNTWIASYGAMLADFGYKRFIDHVSFDIESSPTGGVNQRDYTLDRISPTAPQVCKEILHELVPKRGATTADVSTCVTVHFDPAQFTPTPTDLSEVGTQVVRWLPGIESALAASGAAVLGRATTPWVIRRLRAQYDPAVRGEVLSNDSPHDADGELLTWRDAGPIRTGGDDHVYRTDSGHHVSWVLEAPPQGVFTASVLLPLLAPGPFYRRVSMVYRPYPASEAAEVLENEVTGGTLRALWARKTHVDETQRERDDRAKARADTRDESMGSGVGRFTLYITTTVTNPELLDAAVADVEERAGSSKIRLRRARGSQAAMFAVSLGWGIDPTQALGRPASDRWDG
ncbi:hypothetical protein JOJ86_007413 [Rhodococcus percolatus]|nr:hypothetical protein [Rhodococcus opacus]MBP2209620.1 hypothetical protein [Rhodococcus opacus]